MENTWGCSRPIVDDKFGSVISNNFGNTQYMVAMEQNLRNQEFGLKDANVKIMNRNTDNVIKSHKCNQCSYSSAL